MLEARCDIWTEPADAICITTNGFVKSNGNLVMGAGVAGQAQARYPKFPKLAGEWVKEVGNHVSFFTTSELGDTSIPASVIITFPVKHVWYESADLELIKRSAQELMLLADSWNYGSKEWQKILLPRPGCGNGHLKWEDVKPVIEPILDDRVIVVSY